MKLATLLALVATPLFLSASTPNPTLFFTDLTSGPAGAIVTVYGANLLPSIEVNGVQATIVASSASKVSFVVPQTTSGSITMPGSNALAFTIRAGNIYYVATNGSDSNPGTQSQPWGDIPYGFNTASCGDIVYVMNGVQQTGLDNYGASLSVERICSQAAPLAVVGYPGATVTIGSATGQEYGIRNPDVNGDGYNGFVFANLVVRGNNEAIKTVSNQYWRIVGSDFSCPYGSGQSGCVIVDQSSNIQFLGNSIHDTGAGGTKYYHSFYATTNSNHIEVGWNHIYGNNSCRGVQFYSTSGSPQYDLVVHDNIISDQECDGINFSTVDATLGPIEAYNNLVYHVGLGGTTDGTPNYACIASLGYGNPGGQMLIYGNTMADCGSAGGSTAGAITVMTGSPTAVVESNLAMQNSGELTYSPNTTMSLVQYPSNVFLTTGTSGVVDANYHLVSGSPAIGAGTSMSGIFYDQVGNPRPQTGASDAGAYLYQTGGSTSGATANLSATSLSFGSLNVGSTSHAQTVTLVNSGGSALSISSILLTGADPANFAETNNCGSSLAANSNCTISVTFTPSAADTFSATLSIADNIAGSPQTVALSGTGTTAAPATANLSATSLSFGSVTVGSTSTAKTVKLSNSGGAALSMTSISLTGANPSDFAETNTCGSSLAANSNCTISVTFKPAAANTYAATLSIADNVTGSPQTVALSGTGTATAPPADFAVSATPGSATITAGGSTTFSVTVQPSGSYTSAVNLSVSGLPSGMTGTFSPASLTPNSASVTSTLTVAPSTTARENVGPAGLLAIPALAFVLLVPLRRRRWQCAFRSLLLIAFAAGTVYLSGCGASTVQGTTNSSNPQTYTLTINGTSGSNTHSATLQLTVQ